MADTKQVCELKERDPNTHAGNGRVGAERAVRDQLVTPLQPRKVFLQDAMDDCGVFADAGGVARAAASIHSARGRTFPKQERFDGDERVVDEGYYASEGAATSWREASDRMVKSNSHPVAGKLPLLERRRCKHPSLTLPLASNNGKVEGVEEIRKLSDRFSLLERLGSGAHGVVYKAINRDTGAQVSLKSLRIADEELVASAHHEFDVLRSAEHRYVIRAGEIFQHTMGVAMTMEYFGGHTLQAAVEASPTGCFHEGATKGVFGPLVEAIDHLHRNGIVHRDIKTENILVSKDLSDVRLIDFSVAHRRSTDGEILEMTGTKGFLAPEVLSGEDIAEPCDIWGAGLCMYWMLFGHLPQEYAKLSQRDLSDALRKTFSDMFETDGVAMAAVEEVLRSCLTRSVAERATAAALLACNWIAGAAGTAEEHRE